jgi:hypothetical protein
MNLHFIYIFSVFLNSFLSIKIEWKYTIFIKIFDKINAALVFTYFVKKLKRNWYFCIKSVKDFGPRRNYKHEARRAKWPKSPFTPEKQTLFFLKS